MKKIISILFILLLLVGCSKEADTREDTFVVGMECDYAPFNWSTSDSSSGVQIEKGVYADGYDVRIAQKIADALGKKLVIKKIEWNELLMSLKFDNIDAIIAGMTNTPERSKNVDFTSPYYESEMVILVKKDSPLTSVTNIQELSGYKVLGQTDTICDECIDQIEGVIHVDPISSYSDMVNALKNNDVDAVTAELPVANAIISANSDLTYVSFAKGNGFEADTSVSIAISQNNPELLKAVENILGTISQDERNKIMTEAIEDQPTGE